MAQRITCAIGLWLLLPLAVHAASKSLEVTVAAGMQVDEMAALSHSFVAPASVRVK